MVLPAFYIIGIALRTTNQNGQSHEDIGTLWKRFFEEDIRKQIPNKVGEAVYNLYTEFESDSNGPYTVVLGVEVANLDAVPKGMYGLQVKGGKYLKIDAKGPLPDSVGNAWKNIWERGKEIDRAYTTDFDKYDLNHQNPETNVVEIHLSVN